MGLPGIDVAVLLLYLVGVVAFGCWFVRKNKTAEDFTAAGRSLPGWAVGLSIFGTFLSSNTFLGVPGKAFGGNWNSFVFSLSLPIAAWIGVKLFIPFYRGSGEISAYHHLEKRFGVWARIYADVCYLLAQVGRMGAIMFGVSLGLNALLGWDIRLIIVISGVLVTLYTLLGGIEAVIWTDVVQSIILIGGALLVLLLVLFDMPGGPGQALSIAADNSKFSLGSFVPNPLASTFWVVLLYGIFINLGNFGINQSFIQRYHTAKSDAEARKSLWLGSLLYVPISAVLFFIGSSLFSYYTTNDQMLREVKMQVAETRVEEGQDPAALAATLKPADVGDKVLPHFISNKLRGGLAGLLLAAIFAAAMSSIDTSLNSSSTIILTDIYKPFFRPGADDATCMRVLRISTIAWGLVGTGVALALTGVKSILDAWWVIQGIFSGAMLGLFLLGILAKKAKKPGAVAGVIVGVLVIAWMTMSPKLESLPSWLRNPLHANMTIVVGTLSIFLVGLLVTRLRESGDSTPGSEG